MCEVFNKHTDSKKGGETTKPESCCLQRDRTRNVLDSWFKDGRNTRQINDAINAAVTGTALEKSIHVCFVFCVCVCVCVCVFFLLFFVASF